MSIKVKKLVKSICSEVKKYAKKHPNYCLDELLEKTNLPVFFTSKNIDLKVIEHNVKLTEWGSTVLVKEVCKVFGKEITEEIFLKFEYSKWIADITYVNELKECDLTVYQVFPEIKTITIFN